MESFPGIVCVAGPTASGKSALAVRLARRLSGEVVSADSMQVYRGMDIGTAKPSPEEMGGVRHHMLNVAGPEESYSAARYAKEAGAVVEDILARGKLPIVAGGTGLYLDALVYGADFPPRAQDGALREKLSELARREGAQALYEKLRSADPESAARLHPNDVKRVARALEIAALTGGARSEFGAASKRNPPRFKAVKIGLFYSDRKLLYRCIDARVDDMLARGLLDEARALLALPGVREGTAAQAIGYKELIRVLEGACTLEEAAEEIKRNTRRYAKRQMTWFRRDTDIFWIDRCACGMEEAAGRALAYLAEAGVFPDGA